MSINTVGEPVVDINLRPNSEGSKFEYFEASLKSLDSSLDQILFDPNWREYLHISLNSILTLYTFLFFSLNHTPLLTSFTLSTIIFFIKVLIHSKVSIFIIVIEYLLFLYIKTVTSIETLGFLIPMILIYNSLPNKSLSFAVKGLFFLPSVLFYENFIKLATEIVMIKLLLKIEGNLRKKENISLNVGGESNENFEDSFENFEPMVSYYEKIFSKLGRISELLKNIHGINKNSEKALSHVEEVIFLLETTPNIYRVNIEEITKKLDDEDRIFIEQNSIQTSESSFIDIFESKPIRNLTEKHYNGKSLYPIIKKIGKDWNFNTLLIDDCTGHQSLFTCGEYVFKLLDFHSSFSIPTETSEKFLKTLESKYLKNPYHNSCHSADMMNSFLFLCNAFISNLPSIEIFGCVLACLGHDVGHPGKNNRFLIHTKNPLAVYYNDISVLENMHARELFIILNESCCNILEGVPDYWCLRKLIIDLILATDMAKHFEFLGNFRFSDKNLSEKLENFADRFEIYKLCIKAADLGHTFKSEDIHEKWCSFIIEEFFNQGDLEKQLGVTVSMYCDRDTTDIRKSQAGFLKNIAMPLYVALFNCLDLKVIDEACIGQIKKNIMFWEGKRDSNRQSTMLSPKLGDMKRPRFRRITDKNNLE